MNGIEFDALRAHVKKNRHDNESRLELARELWIRCEIKESMSHYARLTRTDLNLQVIEDLNRYRQTRPDAAVLRTLGNAYMKEGAVKEAFAVYNQAMDVM